MSEAPGRTGDCLDQLVQTRSFGYLSYPAGMSVSNRAAIMLADQLRHHRIKIGTRWRRLDPGQQALLTLAHLRKGETYADLARGFAIGTTTVYCYIREALKILAALAPTLQQAIECERASGAPTAPHPSRPPR